MIGYLNERSLEDHVDWAAALRLFLAAAQELSVIQMRLFRDSDFFFGEDFKRRFNSISFSVEVRPFIRQLVFSERYYNCWRPQRISTAGDYYSCSNPRLRTCDESICEAAEQKLRHNESDIGLLSAADSEFGSRDQVLLSKDVTTQEAELRNSASITMVKRWIAEQRGYYDPSSSSAPRDFQTILEKAPERFRPTGKVERRFSRKIFQEIATGNLYYVDEGHPGHSAHLEVFSPNGKQHLGIADIDTGEINEFERVKGRQLKL
jgi:hypothetical protein